jgi:hypothetical protein
VQIKELINKRGGKGGRKEGRREGEGKRRRRG